VDLTRSRFFDMIATEQSNVRKFKSSGSWQDAAQASCAFGIFGSEVAEWQAAMLLEKSTMVLHLGSGHERKALGHR